MNSHIIIQKTKRNRFLRTISALLFCAACTLNSGTVNADAVLNLDFDNTSLTGGTYFAIPTDGAGNKYLQLLSSSKGNYRAYAYYDTLYTANSSIVGSVDLKLENVAADGFGIVLANSSLVNVRSNSGTPNGETPNYAGSFAIGFQLYNKSIVSLHWDGKQVASFDMASESFNIKTAAQWFKTAFQIDYLSDGSGASVTLTFKDTEGTTFATKTATITGMTPYPSQLLLTGRTGGAMMDANMDNIQISFNNAINDLTWKANTTGTFSEGNNWVGGSVPAAGQTGYVADGNQTINNLVLKEGRNLYITGGTTSSGSSNANIDVGSTLQLEGGSLSANNTIRVGSDGTESRTAREGTGYLNIYGGTLDANGWFSIGFNSDAVVNVLSGTLNANGGNVFVIGDSSGVEATLNISGGTVNSKPKIIIGTSSGSTGTVNLSTTGTLLAQSGLQVGAGSNTATFNMSGGTFKSANSVTVKNKATATFNGTTVIDSSIDSVTTANYLIIGQATSNSLNKLVIDAGATGSTDKPIRLGNSAGSTGAMDVNGTFTGSGSHFIIGYQGQGDVNVDGGTLNVNHIILGDNTGVASGSWCGGTLDITNGGIVKGTTMSVGDKSTAKGYVTLSGASQLRVNNAFFGGNTEAGAASVGQMAQTGASLFTASSLVVKNTSQYAMSKESYALISENAKDLAFDDAFRTKYSAGSMYVGIDADNTGSVTHSNGTMVLPGLTINSGSSAVINSAAAINSDSSITPNTTEFFIGYTTNSASNQVVVNEGGKLTSNQSVSLGRNDNSYGELNVFGTAELTGGYFLIGVKGEGKVVVDGGKLTAKNTILGDNQDNGSTPTGSLDITNDAEVNLSQLSVADKSTSTGTLTVDGSALTIAGNLIVSNQSGSTGSLSISGNSVVKTGGTFFAGKSGVGNVTLSGNSQLSAKEFHQSHDNSTAAGSFTIEDNAIFTVNGVHMIFSRNSSGVTTLKDNATINFSGSGVLGMDEKGGAGVLNIEGGTFNAITGGNQGGYAIWNSGQVKQSGGVMNMGTKDSDSINLMLKSANAKYELTGGTLNVTGAIRKDNAAATFDFKDGTLSANNINFSLTQEKGVLSPGINWDGSPFAIGTTTINGDYTALTGSEILLEIDAANNKADQLIVTGATNFASGAILNLDFDPTLLQGGMSFDLLDLQGTVSGLDYLYSSLSTSAKYYFDISESNGVVTFSIDSAKVPEPSSVALLILGAAGLFWIRKRVAARKQFS